jgi:hypothetical protein
MVSGTYTDSGPLTQVPLSSLSQTGLMSQGNPYPGFSQSELSQVCTFFCVC